MQKAFDRFFHLKFSKWAFMKEFANFVPGPTRIPHWDAQFKMYGDRYDDWGPEYGSRFVLDLNGEHTMVKDKETDTFVSEDGKYTVLFKSRGFLPDEVEWQRNEKKPVVEYVDALPLIGAERVAALTDAQRAKMSPIEVTYAQDLFNAFMDGAKTEVAEDGTTKIVGWTPWVDALQSLLGAHPVRSADVPIYVHTEGRTIKGANIELRVGGEVYRTADFYWHGDKTANDAKVDPKAIGDYGGFTRCSASENYSFASFHFEIVK